MITIELNNAQRLQSQLNHLVQTLQQPRRMMSAIAQELDTLTQDNFTRGAFGTKKWKKSEAAKKRSGQTLLDTGTLRDSVTTETGANFARIGTNVEYAAVHHLGGNAGKNHSVHLPARPFLPIDGNKNLQNGGETRLLDVAKRALQREML
nr:MAG TPA: virion morphogenesis protein [Bacteriophage sp.]